MRNSFPRYYGRHLRILSAEKYFTVGCGKANCGNAAREGALGYDLGAPFVSALHNLFRSGPRNALSNVFRANNVRPYGYAPANLFDAVRRGRRTLRCTVKSFGSIYRVERHKVNCPKGRRSHPGGPAVQPICTLLHRRINSSFSILNYCFAYEKSTAFAVLSVCR